MSYLIDKIVEYNNLYWAWEKAKWFYKPGDIWFNELEVAKFEGNLTIELRSIKEDVSNGKYKLGLIQPVAFPKSKNKETGDTRTRQTFWVSVRDQVTWLAVANVLGRFLDAQMPFWSYGNRLYISIFKPEMASVWKFGYYRNTTKFTYRKWSQSWPLYRRHITITTKLMTNGNNESEKRLDEKEEIMMETNSNLSKDHPLKAKYLEKEYWGNLTDKKLYWAGIDLEKFYPNINIGVIKANIKKYYPEGFFDADVEKLIEELLLFKIDVAGWSELELGILGIDSSSSYFEHIPTGLFVAGFLANLALLEIDKIIEEKLSKNKSVAHFRYVDDHVILATSFDELTQWISEYKALIIEKDIGTSFNLQKTEPDALSAYFIHSEIEEQERKPDWSEVLDKKKKKAEEETELDPEFPSPLMTQTLAKVSKIAGTEFQLLDPEEEKSIIADIEHLLLTNFPDQELRKDTRVSFAARMLSSLVPLMTVDSSKQYNLYRLLVETKTEINETEKEIKKRAKSSKREFFELKLKALKEAYDQSEKSFNNEKEKLKREEKKLNDRTLKLLLKAVRENHDKVRLWTRLFEFCLKSGNTGERRILSEIDNLEKKGETNTLSITFIHSLILQVLSNLLFQALAILLSGTYPIKRKEKAKEFLEQILTESTIGYFEGHIVGKPKPYEKTSYDIFKFTCGTAIHLLKEINSAPKGSARLIKRFKLVNWADDSVSFVNRTSYAYNVWAWWVLKKLPAKSFQSIPYLWGIIEPKLDPTNSIDKTIIQFYPQHLAENTLKAIDSNPKEFAKYNEGWLFDVLKYIRRNGSDDSYAFLVQIKSKSESLIDHITLSDWIDWTYSQENKLIAGSGNRCTFDPRLGEWTALQIIKLIAEEIIGKTENVPYTNFFSNIDYHTCIHPANFKLPKDWTKGIDELSWEQLRSWMASDNSKVEFRSKKDLIHDRRFVPDFYFFSDEEKVQSILSALGSLLICLLAKNMDLPHNWNPLGHQLAWSSLYHSRLKDVAISSYTRNIIDACFSKRNIETIMLKSFQIPVDFNYDDDSLYDPPELPDVKEFVNYINICQKKLEKQQLTVASHQPRQLTPISLKQLLRKGHQETLNEEEEL